MEAEAARRATNSALTYFSQRRYDLVEAVLLDYPIEHLVSDLELPLLLASAKTQLFKHSEAKAILHQVAPMYLKARDEFLRRRWQNGYAVLLVFEGDFDSAKSLLAESLDSAMRHQNQRLIGFVNNTLGIVSAHHGEVESALSHFSRSIAAWRLLGNQKRIGFGHFNIAVLMREWGDAAKAAVHYLTSRDYIGQTETSQEKVLTTSERAMILLSNGEVDLAHVVAARAVAKADSLANPFLRAVARRSLGAVLTRSTAFEQASNCLTEAHQLALLSPNRLLLGEITEELALTYLIAGKTSIADERRAEAEGIYMSMGLDRHASRFLHRYAELLPKGRR